jgi:phage terminase large subunit
VLCAREVQKSIKDSVHKLLSDQVEALGLQSDYNVLQNEIRGTNGTEFIFTGLSNQTSESLKSYEGVDRCWVEEGQKVSRRSWDILIPTIRKNGSEIWISLNPELDTDETYVRFIDNPRADSKVVEINWNDNPFFPDVLKAERLEFLRQVAAGIRTQDDYDNIWEGKCRAAVEGAIFHREILAAKAAGRLRNVPYDPLLRVHTIWDLGWNDKMSILLVQKQASELRVIEYIEDSHRTLADYVADLRAKPYRWGTDYLPHDARAKDYKSGKSAEEILVALERKVAIVPEIGVEAGIKAARLIFPRTYFDKDRAGALFNRLGRYRRQINQTTNEPGAPLHDENSHGADGYRYLGVIADQLTNEDMVITDPYAGFRRHG